MKKVRVAVIGTGDFAQVCHIPGIASHEQAEVVAVCGRNAERSGELASRFGIKDSHGDIDALFSKSDFDAVAIVTPDAAHYTAAIKAIQAGKHVFCEKPLAINVAEATEMYKAAQRAGVINMVAFTFRYMHAMRQMRKFIHSGFIGRPVHISMQVYWGEFLQQQSLTWRDRASESAGGIFADAGAHLFDAAGYLLAPVSRVFAQTDILQREPGSQQPDTADLASWLARLEWSFEGKSHPVSLSMHASRLSRPRGPVHEVQVIGSRGSLGMPLTRGENEYLSFLAPGAEAWQQLPLPDEASMAQPMALGRMMRAFVDAILRGAPEQEHDATFEDGLKAQLALDAGQKSTRSHASESVDYSAISSPQPVSQT